MILSDRDIYKINLYEKLIKPFSRDKLQPASYDLTLSGDFLIKDREVNWDGCDEFMLYPGQTMLASTKELIQMPINMCAILKDKSSTARKHISTCYNAGFIDPGFTGNITLALKNHSNEPFDLKKHPSLTQIVFIELTSKPVVIYKGHYQGKTGVNQSVFSNGRTTTKA